MHLLIVALGENVEPIIAYIEGTNNFNEAYSRPISSSNVTTLHHLF